MKNQNHKHRGKYCFVFWLLLIGYLLLGSQGYGNDSDTYHMLLSGQNLLLNGLYEPSRSPGYLVPEVAVGAASLLGGHLLSNAISAVLAAGTLYLFYQLLRRHGFSDREALLGSLIVGLNPHFIIAASSSIDYVYSLFFILAGINILEKSRSPIGGVLFALAVSSRLSNALVIGVIFLYFLVQDWRQMGGINQKLLIAGVLTAALAAALYIPSYLASGSSLKFLTYAIGDWDFLGHLTRFGYKNIYLWGLLPAVFLCITAAINIVQKRPIRLSPAAVGALAALVLHEVLFLKVPLVISYLLPVLFLTVPLWLRLINNQTLAVVLLLLTVSFNLVNLDILDRVYTPDGTEAVGASVGLYLRDGLLIEDLSTRNNSQAEYMQRLGLPLHQE